MAYLKYTDTPEAIWFQSVPDNWRATKMRELFSERNTKVSDKDYAALSVGKMGVVPQLDTAVKTDNGDNRKLICQGDFAINSRSDRKGAGGISVYDGSASLIITVLKPHHDLNGRFYHYLLRSHYFSEEFYRNGHGLVSDLWTTKWDTMRNIYIPVPPRDEQDQIVRYLDWQLSKINKLIHGYQRQNLLINDIKNRKIQDIILTADTRKYMRLKYLGSFEKGGGFSRDNLCVNGFPAILYGDIYTQYVYKTDLVNHRIDEGAYSKAVKIGHGDIVFAGTGETKEEIGKPIIYLGQDIVAIGGDVISFKNKSSLSSKYLLYFLYSEEALRYRYINGKGDIIVHISSGSLGNHIIPIPTKENEERIVSQIEKVIYDTTKIVNDILNEIQLLKEYRTRLISDVVTGQMDVREIEIPEYTPEEDTDESFESDADDIENAGEEVDSDE